MRESRALYSVLWAAALVAGACSAASELPYNGGDRPAQAQAGECWCLFTIPAQFKTEEYQVMVQPESCTYEVIPARYETRTERVCVEKERKVKHKIPAEYGVTGVVAGRTEGIGDAKTTPPFRTWVRIVITSTNTMAMNSQSSTKPRNGSSNT